MLNSRGLPRKRPQAWDPSLTVRWRWTLANMPSHPRRLRRALLSFPESLGHIPEVASTLVLPCFDVPKKALESLGQIPKVLADRLIRVVRWGGLG